MVATEATDGDGGSGGATSGGDSPPKTTTRAWESPLPMMEPLEVVECTVGVVLARVSVVSSAKSRRGVDVLFTSFNGAGGGGGDGWASSH